MPARISVLVACIFLLSCADQSPSQTDAAPDRGIPSLPSGNVIDLTYTFDSETVYWPTAGGFVREVTSEEMTEQGYFYAAGNFSSAEHGGTHVDAPYHFAEGGRTVDEIPLEQLMGPAFVIDVSASVSANPDYLISTEDIRQWETERRPIPDGSIVMFRTGLGKFWPDRARYLGTDATGLEAVAELHSPGLHPDAATWLVENRNVDAVGIDTPSIDYGQSQDFRSHQILFEENIPAFENVANLDQLPDEGALVVALPMKIGRGSGGPLRIIAFLP